VEGNVYGRIGKDKQAEDILDGYLNRASASIS
jgi:hypothetical protein